MFLSCVGVCLLGVRFVNSEHFGVVCLTCEVSGLFVGLLSRL